MSVSIVQPEPSHNHIFTGSTEDVTRHRHSFSGITGPEINMPPCSDIDHIHEIFITHCSFLNLHNHSIKGITGPPIWISATEHYHCFSGLTIPCAADGHSHDFSGMTKII